MKDIHPGMEHGAVCWHHIASKHICSSKMWCACVATAKCDREELFSYPMDDVHHGCGEAKWTLYDSDRVVKLPY